MILSKKYYTQKELIFHEFYNTDIYFCLFPSLFGIVLSGTVWGGGKIQPFSNALKRVRANDLVLLVFSLGFYMWACFDDVFRFIIYIFVIHLFGLWIQKVKNKRWMLMVCSEKDEDKAVSLVVIPFAIGIAFSIFALVWFKYCNALTYGWNWLLKDNAAYKSIIAPLGISFITFSAISYLTDIYRGYATSGNLIDCALYLSFFPKVISGPIVMWKDFQGQIRSRRPALEPFTAGLNRIMLGFGKKIILADSFGACLSAIGTSEIDQITALGSMLLYAMQIYYDFSGYSDIAIGLSELFGFEIDENFRTPYLSRSIPEFWRRWHISLGAWFRDYLYYPLMRTRTLSGIMKKLLKENHKRAARIIPTAIALFVTWFTMGFWHGAAWHYIFYGLFHGGFIILSVALSKEYKAIKGKLHIQEDSSFWHAFQILRTFAIVNVGYLLFRSGSMREAVRLAAIAIGVERCELIPYTWEYFFDFRMLVFLGIALVGSTVFGSSKIRELVNRGCGTKVGFLVRELLLLAVFVLSIMFMVNSTYSPFIYFQY